MKINKNNNFSNVLCISLIALSAFTLASNSECSDKEFDLLINFVENNTKVSNSNIYAWIVDEKEINLSSYLILDLRSVDDFTATPNSIDRAINTTLNEMFNIVAKNTNEKVLVTCYSGQSASYATMLLRLKGIEAYIMAFGMSAHDESLDKWTANCSDKNADDLVKTASPALPTFDYPELNTGETTAEAILDARLEAAIKAWNNGLLIDSDTVIDNASDYNIVNYCPESDYLYYGHIDGAYQVTPGTITSDSNLSAFDPEGTNILYCYTGQAAAAEIAYLTVLGYNVKSIKFGFNNMNWSALRDHKWLKPWDNK